MNHPSLNDDGLPAALWRRAGAYLVDSIFLSVLSWVFSAPVLGAIYFWEMSQDASSSLGFMTWVSSQDALWVEVLNLIIYALVAAVVTAEWLYRWGNSPGKWLFRFWVTQAGGYTTLSRKQAWLRTLALGGSYGTLGLGFLLAVVHPRRQALHDLLAKTWCVQRRS
jgi:uncharacterized RDD family membrane protein YckC